MCAKIKHRSHTEYESYDRMNNNLCTIFFAKFVLTVKIPLHSFSPYALFLSTVQSLYNGHAVNLDKILF